MKYLLHFRLKMLQQSVGRRQRQRGGDGSSKGDERGGGGGRRSESIKSRVH